MNRMKGLAAILGATVLMMLALACEIVVELAPTSDGALTGVATSTAAPPPAAAEATAVPSPTPASPAAPAPAVTGSIAPNLRLTFAGVEYSGVEILGASGPTGPIVCCGTPIEMDDMEGIGTGAEHNPDGDTTVQIYRTKAGGTTDVYTFHAAQTLGTTPATWTRWTAASLSGVHLTLSAEQAPGQPLTVNVVAEIVGGPDNNRDLSCHSWIFTLGDGGISQPLYLASCYWTPDSTFPRRFETSYTYEMPGTYEITFYYGLLKSEPISVEVGPEGIAIAKPTPTPVPILTPTPTALPPEGGTNTQSWRGHGVSGSGWGFYVYYPESWIDGPAAGLHIQKRSVDPHLSVGPYLELRAFSPETSPPASLDELVEWAIEGLEEGSDPLGLLTYHEIFGRASEVKVLNRAGLLGSASDPGTGEERVIVGARAIEYLVRWPEGSQYRAKLLVIHGEERVYLVQVFGQQEPFSNYEADVDSILCTFSVVLEDGQDIDPLAEICGESLSERGDEVYARQLHMPVFADSSQVKQPWSLDPVPQDIGDSFFFRGARNALGNQKSLVVLVEFADVKHRPQHTVDFYQERWFGESLSVASYFAENSYGRMRLSGQVYPRWIQLPENKEFYDLWANLLTGIRNAIDTDIDFQEYDRNGDRLVDHLVIVVAGQGPARQAERNFRVATREGVYLGPFAYLQESDSFGVSIHEVAHELGPEDQFYNATGTEFVGDYGMMGFGAQPNPPTHINVYNKIQLSWIRPEEVFTIKESGTYSLNAIEETPAVYKIAIPADDPDPSEYFLIVNRYKEEGFDSALPDQGLVIWHVDEFIKPMPGGISPNMRTEYGHRHLTMVPASGDFDNPGYQAPFYAGNQANNELTPSTTPSSDGYYFPSGISITNVSGKGPVMSFRVTLPQRNGVPEVTNISIVQEAGAYGYGWLDITAKVDARDPEGDTLWYLWRFAEGSSYEGLNPSSGYPDRTRIPPQFTHPSARTDTLQPSGSFGQVGFSEGAKYALEVRVIDGVSVATALVWFTAGDAESVRWEARQLRNPDP